MDTIGKKIYKLRKSKGLSQESLALDLELSRQTINKWEKDEVEPNIESVRILCDYFEIDSDYLINDKEPCASAEAAVADDKAAAETVIANNKLKRKKMRIRVTCIVFSCIFFLLFTVALFLTVWSGIVVNSPNIGFSTVSTSKFNYSTFIFMIILDVVFLISGIIMAFTAKKLKM